MAEHFPPNSEDPLPIYDANGERLVDEIGHYLPHPDEKYLSHGKEGLPSDDERDPFKWIAGLDTSKNRVSAGAKQALWALYRLSSSAPIPEAERKWRDDHLDEAAIKKIYNSLSDLDQARVKAYKEFLGGFSQGIVDASDSVTDVLEDEAQHSIRRVEYPTEAIKLYEPMQALVATAIWNHFDAIQSSDIATNSVPSTAPFLAEGSIGQAAIEEVKLKRTGRHVKTFDEPIATIQPQNAQKMEVPESR